MKSNRGLYDGHTFAKCLLEAKFLMFSIYRNILNETLNVFYENLVLAF